MGLNGVPAVKFKSGVVGEVMQAWRIIWKATCFHSKMYGLVDFAKKALLANQFHEWADSTILPGTKLQHGHFLYRSTGNTFAIFKTTLPLELWCNAKLLETQG